MYPTSILKSSDTYFKAQMGLYKEGVIAEKEAHLVALATSAAIKCEYCIPYHIAELKRLGASEDEIKTAVLIAANPACASIIASYCPLSSLFRRESILPLIGNILLLGYNCVSCAVRLKCI